MRRISPGPGARVGFSFSVGVGVSVAACVAILLGTPARAQAAVTLRRIATASSPLFVAHSADARLFVVERAGRIRIFDRSAGAFVAAPFLDISAKVSTNDERGLLSMAFHPDFATNGFFFLDYTNPAGDTVIERYRTSANPNVADPASASTLLVIPQPFSNHNGGQIQIGPNDGYLYVGMGDGGSEGDPNCTSQRKDTLLGKMLRVDVRQNLGQAPFYGIPVDNPFRLATDPTNQIADEIWAFGLRNPWRFSFDRSTGDLFVGDVGQSAFEEVDLHRASAPGGQNFGWKVMEGTTCFNSDGCPAGTPACNAPSLTPPIFQYGHGAGDCAIVGGYVYRGGQVPELAGWYVFGDFCTGSIRAIREMAPGIWQSQLVVQANGGLTSFGEDASGELFAIIGGDILQLVSDAKPVPALGHRALAMLGLLLLLLPAGSTGLTSGAWRFWKAERPAARARQASDRGRPERGPGSVQPR